MKYAYIQETHHQYSVSRLCYLLEVSTSGYYDWCDRPMSSRAIKNQQLLTKLRCFYQASFRIYGAPRLHKDLIDSGEQLSQNRVARLMKRAKIKAKTAKRFVITTHSKNTLAPAPDLLQRQFTTTRKDVAWVTDTTFIKTRKGWLYLATVLDLYSRKIIGWAMSSRNNKQLVCDALMMSVWRRKHPKQVIVHSDQGSTYASNDYLSLLEKHQLIPSMSRKGECLDNAVAESFFGTLKTEWVDDQDYKTHEEARKSLFEYIEMFYNRKRRHSHLGYKSPAQFERESVS